MSRDLSNPLQALVARAARDLPAETGETARRRARLDDAGPTTVILADCSSSMAELAGGRTKAAVLREALDLTWPDLPGAVLIAFGSTAAPIASPATLPTPSGGTALHLALDAAGAHRPRRTVVISDGRPDSEDRALDAAGRIPGTIEVIYCGPDSDAQAVAFMGRLARIGGGRVVVRDVVRMARPGLAGDVRRMLGLPAPGVRP